MVGFCIHDSPAQLREYLFLGSEDSAADGNNLEDLGITHVLNVADDVECYHINRFEYLHLPIRDGGEDDAIFAAFDSATQFVERVASKGGKVLVHCFAGVNRSATVAMAVLMNIEGWTLAEAYEHTRNNRPIVCPFIGNRQKIATWEQQTRRVCSLPTWLSEDGGGAAPPPGCMKMKASPLHPASECVEPLDI
eukprot:UN4745